MFRKFYSMKSYNGPFFKQTNRRVASDWVKVHEFLVITIDPAVSFSFG